MTTNNNKPTITNEIARIRELNYAHATFLY